MQLKNKKPSAGKKHAILKKMVKGQKKDGKSPLPLDNGLGNASLAPGSGGGSNLGKSGVF